MPGNEVGDRVHNFFGQENLSQGQYHSQAVDGNWPGLSNSLWVGNQRTTGAPFISNLKNFNVQQSDPEPAHTSSSHLRHGLNLTQPNARPESGRHQASNQQTAVNGYMQGHQAFLARQNETGILGVDTESDWHSLPRGLSALESQGSGLELYKKNMTRSDASESPVNFDFLGGQQNISGRHPGMLQSLPRQQTGINDMQLLQQQVMLTQMQELQRQQQLHQLEARQQSSMNPASSISKQTVGNQSASLINGIPINEPSNLMWQPEVIASNANWLQRGASPVMQGSSNGLMLSPEQGQALRVMGLVPNQVDQSLYGLPISSSRGAPNLYSHVQVDKPAMSQVSIPHQYSHVQGEKSAVPHISTGGNSFPSNQYAAFSDQANTNDATSVSRQDIQGKNIVSPTVPGINSGLNIENLQQVNSEQRNVLMQGFHGRQELAGSSDTSQDKMVVQVTPSQNVATLDPTEERILFGSDDSIWDAFGRNTGGFNMLDGTDSFGGIPSVQSGSWSALMQSAVAETSSGDMGVQEEWSGLSFRNVERLPGNERPSTIDNSKQQSVWAENNLQSASNMNSRPFLRPDDATRPNNNISYSGLPGFHQSGLNTSQEQHDRVQTDSSQRSIPQFLERGKWLDCSPQQKPPAEGSHIYGNASNPSGLEINEKNISGSWTQQQALSSGNSSGEPFNRPNGWNLMKPVPADSNSSMKTHENESSLQPHREKSIHEMSQVSGIWEHGSDANSSVGLRNINSAAGNLRLRGEDSGINGVAAVQNSGTTWINQQSHQQLSNSLNVDVWRDTDKSAGYKGNEGPGKFQHQMENNPLVLESLKNAKGAGEIHEMENTNKKEKSAEAVSSNPSYHRSGGTRENLSLDGSDPRSPKSSGQVNRRPPVTRKFQYHPMGDDVHVEPYGNKHVINSQQPFGGLKGHGQSYLGQPKFGHTDRDYTELEKGNAPAFQSDSKSLDDNASKSILPGHVPKSLTSFDRCVGNFTPNKTASSRVLDTEASDGPVVHPQQNQNSSSQGFGLELAPPTQRLSMVSSHGSSDTVLSTSHIASETGDKGHTWLSNTQTLSSQESSQGELRNNISGTSGQFFDKALQFNVPGNIPPAFTSGFPFSRIQARNENMANPGGQVTNAQSANVRFVDRIASMNQMDEFCERPQSNLSELGCGQELSQVSGADQIRPVDLAIQIPAPEVGTAPQPSVTFGSSQDSQRITPSKNLHNVWTTVSSQHHSLGTYPSKNSSRPLPNNESDMTSGPQKQGDEDSEKDGTDLSGVGPYSLYSISSGGKEQLPKESSGKQILPECANSAEDTVGTSHGKEPVASHSSPAATSRDIEAFGRSLRPNNFLHPNFSLLHQFRSMKNAEIDPSNRDVKRFKLSENAVDKQQVASNHGQQLQVGYNSLLKDVSSNHSPMPSSDPKMLSFSKRAADERETSASSQEVLGYGQENALNVSNNNKLTSIRGEHGLISPQMAPSWFEQYGTFKNGPLYDARKMTPPKIMDQPFIVRNQFDSLHVHNSIKQINSLSDTSWPGDAPQNAMPASVASEHVPSPLLPPAVEPNLVTVRPKKRKSATSELVPWHKELEQDSERLRNMSAAELDWARAANRLIEKVEDDAEIIEDLPSAVKSKRRLVLTTQLMQQLLRPPPAAVLSADVKLHHESVVYSVARLTLGDACSSVSSSEHDTLPLSNKNLLSEKLKAPGKIDQYILKVMEDLVGRARKLESDILRLDSRASILDLRVECQDLERFSVINRFAKFHGRGQNDGAETSSSSDGTPNTQKSHPQKYVVAVPMPRNLPDRNHTTGNVGEEWN
ncbi:hypothetical protein L6164_011232 [Bauhinia variegata]|uniref:Uncharacterized protein n=1 Tax=Bauhinia variegata TaxID=167791 RepID=A0ACB9P7U4_BAUVA|nr:hypothetical protein L6164_011232 [Bauhinia variegata]